MAEGHFPDHEDRRIPLTGVFRHVRPHRSLSQSSESSISSDDERPAERIRPEDSASRERPPSSHVSTRSRHTAVPPIAQRAPSVLSRHSSHRGAHIPPTAEDDREYHRVVERSVTREREPRHPEEHSRRPHHPSRHESEGSLDSSEGSWEGVAHGPAYYPYGYPPPGGHPHGPYPTPRRPSYEHAGHGALMHMGQPDPYYRDHRPMYGPYAHHPMSPPPDPYYGDMRPPMRPPMRPQTMSYHDPHYAEAMMPGYNHHYPPVPHQSIAYGNQHPSQAVSPPLSTPREDDSELKRLQHELAKVRMAQAREREERDLAERERNIALQAKVAALEQMRREQELEKQRAAEISEAKKEERRKTEEELKAKADKAQAEIDKKALEEKVKMEALEAKKKELEAEIKLAKGDPDDRKAPLRLKDTVLDRKFDFPWALAKKWNEFHRLIGQAYDSCPTIQRMVSENRFELVGPERQIILPSVWETTVQPGWEVTLIIAPDQQAQPLMPPHPMPGPFVDDLGWALDGLHLDGAKKKHKSSNKDKKGKGAQHDPSRGSRRNRIALVDAPGVGHMHPFPPPGTPMGHSPDGLMYGEAPMPPPPMHLYPERGDKETKRKDKERDKKKKSSSSGLFGRSRR